MVLVFFYGLFMDPELLRDRGVRVAGPRPARLQGYRPVLGARVTLVPDEGFTTWGMLMEIGARDLERLYADASVSAYRPEPVRVLLEEGATVEAVCYNVPPPLPATPPDQAYARRLHALCARLGFPASYLAVLARACG